MWFGRPQISCPNCVLLGVILKFADNPHTHANRGRMKRRMWREMGVGMMSDGRKEKADRNSEMLQSKISIFCMVQNTTAMI